MDMKNVLFILIAAASLAFGFFLTNAPLKAFEIQRRFYELINWRIEPISVKKEIRNTRWMGIFTIVFVIAVCVYKILHP